MHLQTTLIISNSQCSIKTNHRSQFSNFSHPLKVLKKTDNQMLEMMRKQKEVVQGVFGLSFDAASKKGSDSIRLNTPKSTIGTKRTVIQEKKNVNITQDRVKKQQFFNQDQGILSHIYSRFFNKQLSNSQISSSYPSKYSLTQQNIQRNNLFNIPQKSCQNQSKCFILFGFSLEVIQIQEFHQKNPDLDLMIRFYKYNQAEFYKQIKIKNLIQQPFQQNLLKYQQIIQKLDCDDLLDCEEISYQITFQKSSNSHFLNDKTQYKQQNHSQHHIYFFPNINALKSAQQKREHKTQLTLSFPLSTNRNNNEQQKSQTCSDPSSNVTLTSLRKSHQNFRILQVLEYYLKLQCHSEHIMMTSNQSRIIQEFLDLIYLNNLKQFYIYIDHERRAFNKTNKSTARSILCKSNNNKQSHRNDKKSINPCDTPDSYVSKIFTSDIFSQKQFISIDGQLIINDQFLSKLSQIKVPEQWLDNIEFRQQKKNMYKMKLQQYNLNLEIKEMKSTFVEQINYLNQLIGQEKVSYNDISIESLKTIKNGKIRQNTQQVKQLSNICQNLQIRSQELKMKKKQFQKQKALKDQHQKQNLSQLRKDILHIQKQLNLNRNQLNAIYHTQYANNNVGRQSESKSTKCQTGISLKQTQGKITKSPPSQASKTNLTNGLRDSQNKNGLQVSGLQNLTKGAKQALNNLRMNGRNTLPGGAGNGVQSFLLSRKSSNQSISRYSPILQQLRKHRYEGQLKQEMTKCEFAAQKEYQQLKGEYSKAIRDLRMVLLDCD